MNENALIVLIVKHPIYHMADEQFQLQLASNMNVFSDIFVGLREYVTYHQPVRLLELRKLFGFGVEKLRLEFLNLQFRNVIEQ